MRRRLLTVLVAWYGLYQAGHLALNTAYLLGSSPPPFAGPRGGWNDQGIAFLDAIATFDLLNALLAVVASVGFLRQRSWGRSAVVVAVTVSMYAAAAFTHAALAAGAWRQATSGPYLATWVPFVPVVLLAGVLVVEGLAPRGAALAAPGVTPAGTEM